MINVAYYFILYFILINLGFSNFNNIPFSIVQSVSIGYEDNFMRFGDLELDDYHSEFNYLGDSKYYDSAIISPVLQLNLHPKIKGYKTNFILKGKFTEYTSSNYKSYFNVSGKFELKLKSYNWIKFSYSLTPKYYLRTFVDRDILPLTYYPCDFSSESIYLSYSFPIKKIKKTWLDIKLNFNNQFYNEHFTEYDTKIINLEGSVKSLFFKQYFLSFSSFYAIADNIPYNDNLLSESTKIDRSYIKKGFKINVKRNFKKYFLSNLSAKLNVSIRDYEMDSWYYFSDNWKRYNETELIIECSKKINNKTTIQLSGKHFMRDVISSQSNETLWIEKFKPYSRNELWLRFIFKFSKSNK